MRSDRCGPVGSSGATTAGFDAHCFRSTAHLNPTLGDRLMPAARISSFAENSGGRGQRAAGQELAQLAEVVERMPESVRDSENWVVDDLAFHVLIAPHY